MIAFLQKYWFSLLQNVCHSYNFFGVHTRTRTRTHTHSRSLSLTHTHAHILLHSLTHTCTNKQALNQQEVQMREGLLIWQNKTSLMRATSSTQCVCQRVRQY
jgi:hypothetical protein